MDVELFGRRGSVVGAVVAVADEDKFERHCVPGLDRAGVGLWVAVRGADSITDAYRHGAEVLCSSADGTCVSDKAPQALLYVHEDVRLLDEYGALQAARSLRLRPGLAGAVGSTNREVLPWWAEGAYVGSCITFAGAEVTAVINSGRGILPAGLLDGAVLMEDVAGYMTWRDLPGWHGYDIQRCMEAHARERHVYVHPGLACEHHAPPGKKPREYHLAHAEACVMLAEKWGLKARIGGMEEVGVAAGKPERA